MYTLTTFMLVALSTMTLSRATSIDKRNLVTPSWEFQVFPGGDTVILNGTIQEVHAELLKLNPNWNEDFDFRKGSSSSLAKRTDFDTSDEYYCGGQFEIIPELWSWALQDGIEYLRGVPGVPVAPTGPGWCSRVSCAYNAAITWCNDDPNGKSLYSFGSIADGAQFISDHCSASTYQNLDNSYVGTSGQVFHPTNWNVIVNYQLC